MRVFILYLLLGLPEVLANADDNVATLTAVEGNAKQEYILNDHSAGEVPEGGYNLLLVLPGGDGSADFQPFVTNIGKHAAGPEYLVAQLISVKWTSGQQIIWPTEESEVEDAEFTTEQFLEAVIGDVGKSHKLNAEHIYTLSWSSGGPAAYAASLEVEEIKGSFVAMSVFKPEHLSPLSRAREHRYYIHHSPDDPVCPFRMAEAARDQLKEAGASVEFSTYDGGHGWRGDVFGALRKGIAWLAEAEPPAEENAAGREKDASEPIGVIWTFDDIPGTTLCTSNFFSDQPRSGWSEHKCSIGYRREDDEGTIQFIPVMNLAPLVGDKYAVECIDGQVAITTEKGERRIAELHLEAIAPGLTTAATTR